MLFFKELASKDNALMLLLPDTISSLYRKNLDFDTAKSILQFLLSFVDLQRDLTSLVDKLCQQFPNSPEKRSWRYLAYCLSMLNHNDASIERLAMHFKLYKDALHDETTNGFFLQAVRGRRSKGGFGGAAAGGAAASASAAGGAGGAGEGAAGNATGGAQNSGGADTLEEKILAIAEGTFVDGLEPEESIGKKRGKGKRGAAKATSKKRGRAAQDEEEDDDLDAEEDDAPAPASRSKPKRGAAKKAAPARPQRSTKRRFVPESDSDEVDSFEEDSE